MRQRRPRLDAALYVGLRRYFLTFCTSERRIIFRARDVADFVLDLFLECAAIFDVALIAYCFMPDHVHLLVEGGSEQADLIAFVHQAKQRSAYAFAQKYGGRLWQPSYYDHVLRDDEATLAVARYIFENPVRAGLVHSPRDYALLGSDRFTVDEILDAIMWQP